MIIVRKQAKIDYPELVEERNKQELIRVYAGSVCAILTILQLQSIQNM